jgi:hypothetical protein
MPLLYDLESTEKGILRGESGGNPYPTGPAANFPEGHEPKVHGPRPQPQNSFLVSI